MPIRLSGMISGLDTDSLVQELVSAYSTKKDKYVKEQTKLEWQMDAWKALNTKVYSFYTNSLSQMRFSTAYNLKTASSSDTSKAKVTASSGAVNGDQKLKIKELASSGYLTGAEITGDKDGKKVTASTKLKDLGMGLKEGSMLNIKVDGKETNLTITEDMNIGQLTGYLKEAGLNASFDETNRRLFISSKTSGESHDFSLTGNSGGVEVMQNLGIFAMSDTETEKYQQMAGYSNDDIKNMALNEYLQKRIATLNATYTDKNNELTAKNNELNVKANYARLSDSKKVEAYKKAETNMEGTLAKLGALDASAENYEEQRTKLEKELEANTKTLAIYDEANADLGVSIVRDTAHENADNPIVYKVEKGADYDDRLKSLTESASAQIAENNKEIKANSDVAKANSKLLGKKYTTEEIEALSFTYLDGDGNTKTDGIGDYENNEIYKSIKAKFEDLRDTAADIGTYAESDAKRITGGDAVIELNGATFKSNTNNFSINGLTITAMGKTEGDEEITLTTSTDVDSIYDSIKSFIKGYNELIKEMDKLFNADSAKGYEPLTDEEKDAMSDKEVEKWEAKIKDSLLRRDSTLSSIISTMKMAMSSSFDIGGTKYSLASFGINTSGYFASAENEKGVYHIDGDKDDSSSSGKADKLREMIANDPDAVMGFFSKLSSNLYDKLTKKMASSSVSSAYTIYNDKELKKKYDRYDDTIEKWEDKVTAMEEKYYQQFSAMEVAMAKLQSSTSALSSLMGM